MLWLLWLSPAEAHKIRPAIVTLTFTQDARVQLDIETNAEALLSGIDAGNKNTDDAPQVETYKRLRQYPAEKLAREFDTFANDYSKGLSLQLSGKTVDWVFDSIQVPPVGDIRLSRKSVVQYHADIPVGASTAVWQYAA